MKATQIIFSASLAIAMISMTNCKEKHSDSSLAETPTLAIDNSTLEDEVWHMEELYSLYAKNNDTISFKTLWHDDFIGYGGDNLSIKSKVGSWIPELHKDPNQIYSYELHKKAVNVIGDIVMVFYDADDIWTNQTTNEIRKDTYKMTHTWKKYGDKWLILGGMACQK